MTDSETIARLGNQFGADYVMAGSIQKLGNSNLLIVSIVKIDVIQQVAGDFILYNSLDDLHSNKAIIRKMADNLISLMKKDFSGTDKLAVLPVQFSGGVNEQDGDILAQLLSVYLIRNERYAVYPRTITLDQVQKEYQAQMSGQTRESETVAMGRGINPPYVLSIVSRRIGTSNFFNASVIDLEQGNQIAGYSEPYASLNDGINAMDLLAKELSGIDVLDKDRDKRSDYVKSTVSDEKRAEADKIAREKRAVAVNKFLKNSGFIFSGWMGTAGGFSEGGNIEFCLSPYFSMQTGIEALDKTEEDLKIIQLEIPALVKAKIWIPYLVTHIVLAPYTGITYNFAPYAGEYVKIKSYSPVSLIAGVDVNWVFGRIFRIYAGYQFSYDFSDNIFIYKEESFTHKSYTNTSQFGIGFFIPFRK